MTSPARGRFARACSLAILSTSAFAAAAAGPVIEAVVVMDDIGAIAIVGRDLPVNRRDIAVSLGTAGVRWVPRASPATRNSPPATAPTPATARRARRTNA